MNHKRKLIMWLISGILAFCVVVAIAQTQNGSVKRFPHIEFGETTQSFGKLTLVQGAIPKDIPSEMRVYKVKSLASKKEAFRKLIKSLPLTPGSETDADLRTLERIPESAAQKEEPFGGSIGGWRVEVWSGGQFLIHKDERIDHTQKWEDIPRAPTPKVAQKVADDFLAKIGPLMMDVHFSKVGVGQFEVRGAGNKPGDTIIEKLNVSYSASKEGIPFSAAVGVAVGAGPEVVALSSYLRQIEPDTMVPILSPQEAFKKLRAKEAHLRKGNCITGNVTSISLAYFVRALGLDMSYIMPVYLFEGENVCDKRTERWSAYVEAARPEYLESQPGDKSEGMR